MTKVRAVGIDPGFATFGIAVVECEIKGSLPYNTKLCTSAVLETEKGKKKELATMRVSADDMRRLKYLWEETVRIVGSSAASVVVVEAYTPSGSFGGRQVGGGNSWKASLGYSMAVVVGWSCHIPTLVLLPLDLKREFLHKQSATKEEVAAAVCHHIQGLEAALVNVKPALREHLSDAAGHAYLGLVEMCRQKAMWA